VADRKFQRIGVIGGGAWGTALAQTLAKAGREVMLWAYEADTVREINDHHTNRVFLAGVTLDDGIVATGSLEEISACELLLLVPPAQHMRRIAAQLKPHLAPATPLLICAKGIEQGTGRLLGDIIAEELPGATFGVLSGPSFAGEVARGLPAALTVACPDESLGSGVAVALGSPSLRIYWTDDLIGVQLGGAIKNVLAIAAGIVDGRKLGANAHAALVTRGFAEMRRFAEAMGARAETLSGLSGLGDLLLTCGSTQSRNMSLGRALGEGRSLDDILGERKAVTEGVYTAEAVVRLAGERGVDVPIAAAVRAIVAGEVGVDDAIQSLMARPLRPETEG
jgi:glycerol-3-phosphate dehydrogenase (NAD(P)+)